MPAHIDTSERSNEILAAMRLRDERNIAHCLVTLDVLHCQDNFVVAACARMIHRAFAALRDLDALLEENDG